MKTYFLKVALSLLFLIFITSTPMFCQWNYWSDAVAVTDSLSDNTNPVIAYVYLAEPGYYMFWEKSTDETSTAIYYQNFYVADQPHIFLGSEGVHYTNPQLIDTRYYPYTDSLFYVFYESDEEGYNDIYYRIYGETGFTEPRLLTESAEEKTNLICNLSGRIIWMEQNRIMHITLNPYTHLFDDPVVIDSGNCSSPSIIMALIGSDQPMVAWIKEVNDSSRVMVRQYNTQDGWMEPEVIFTAPQCLNLSFCTGIGSPEVLSWDYFDSTSWRIAFHDFWGDQEAITEFDQDNPFYPKFYSGFIPVSRYFEAGMCSMIYQNDNGSGVYTSPYYYGVDAPLESYQLVSTPGNLVHNPQIFTGKTIGCDQYFINIWEEQVNNRWQLKAVTAYACLSDLEEKNEMPYFDVRVSPNPCNEETSISFIMEQAAEVSLTIRDVSGKMLSTIVSDKLNAGQHTYKWNGASYTPGLYLVILKSGSGTTIKKLILSK